MSKDNVNTDEEDINLLGRKLYKFARRGISEEYRTTLMGWCSWLDVAGLQRLKTSNKSLNKNIR